MVKCIVPGSYDPVTVGHCDIIKRATALFDEVYAVVFENSDKRNAFSAKQRFEMLCASCLELPNVRVELSNGMLVDFMRSRGIGVIVKGVRSATDFDYEYQLAGINHGFDKSVETVILPSRPELQHISSTVVRELIKYNKTLDGYMPGPAIRLING